MAEDKIAVKAQRFLRKYQSDQVVRNWIDKAKKKPEAYRDRDLEFLTVTLDYMEKLAKAVVLLEVNQTAKLMIKEEKIRVLQDNLNKHEKELCEIAAKEIMDELQKRYDERQAKK